MCVLHCVCQFLLRQGKNVNSRFVRVEGFIITASPSYPQDRGESSLANLSESSVLVTQTVTNVCVCVITTLPHFSSTLDRYMCRLIIFTLTHGYTPSLRHHQIFFHVTGGMTSARTKTICIFHPAPQSREGRDTDAVCIRVV